MVLTTCTFLGGRIHVGEKQFEGGRAGDPPSNTLAARLRELPFEVGRLTTGTPPRIDGKMEINDDEISTVLGDEFVKFGQLFANVDGFATRLFDLTEGFLESDGIIEARTKGLTETIDGFADDREALNERLSSLETRLLRQFNALDSLLAQLTSTSNFLAQQLDNLPGYTRPDING